MVYNITDGAAHLKAGQYLLSEPETSMQEKFETLQISLREAKSDIIV